jgi:hypothetical protein
MRPNLPFPQSEHIGWQTSADTKSKSKSNTTQGALHMFTKSRNIISRSLTVAAAALTLMSWAGPPAHAQLTKSGELSRLSDPTRLAQPIRMITPYAEARGCGSKSIGSANIVFQEKGTPLPTPMFEGLLFQANLTRCSTTIFGTAQAYPVSDSIMRLDLAGPTTWSSTTSLQKDINTIHMGYSSETVGDYTARITMWSASNPTIGATTSFAIRIG